MKIIMKKPGEKPEVIEIENKLSALQEAVGGHIEVLPIAEDICVICNEEGKLLGLPRNIVLCGDALVGTILIVGVGRGISWLANTPTKRTLRGSVTGWSAR